jgi:hypothetical protein
MGERMCLKPESDMPEVDGLSDERVFGRSTSIHSAPVCSLHRFFDRSRSFPIPSLMQLAFAWCHFVVRRIAAFTAPGSNVFVFHRFCAHAFFLVTSRILAPAELSLAVLRLRSRQIHCAHHLPLCGSNPSLNFCEERELALSVNRGN